jgi:hypothetical protein
LVAKVEQLMWHEAMAVVLTGAQRVIGSIDEIQELVAGGSDRPPSWIPRERPWPDGFELVGTYSPAGALGARYCVQRGILDYVAHEMRLGACSHGRFRGRLIFPVFDSGGRLVFYQGRATWPPKARERHIKTLSVRTDVEAGEAGAGDVLLNLAYIATRGDWTRVAVVEGPVDCAHAWPDAVATFGKHISGRQIELLMRAGIREIDLCFDGDAMESMLRAAPMLADLFVVRLVEFPAGKDPGDLTKEQIDYCRGQAPIWGSGSRLQQITYPL